MPSQTDKSQLKKIIEVAVLTSETPISTEQIRSLFSDDERPDVRDVERALLELERDCDHRGIELKKVANCYRYQSRKEYSHWLQKLFEIRPRRYSRALMETLSIIVYQQPVTRGEIENIRGVSVSTEIMRTLISNEWVQQTGYKQVPGRPALFRTTRKFLEDFNLKSLDDLPVIDLPDKLD